MPAEKSGGFVDTNVLVYAFDKTRSPKQQIAQQLIQELMEQDDLRLSTQILQELFVTMTRKVAQPCSHQAALRIMDDLAVWPLFVVDYAAIRAAVELSRDAQISFRDALVVVAAERSGADRLYTEDLNTGQAILGVRIVNPFRADPEN